jgi:hypothetical protein
MYYTGKMVHPFAMHRGRSIADLKRQIQFELEFDRKRLPMPKPNYVLLWGASDRANRVQEYKNQGIHLESVRSAEKFQLYRISVEDF